MAQILREHHAKKQRKGGGGEGEGGGGGRAHNGCLANDRTTDGRQQPAGRPVGLMAVQLETVKETLNLIGFFLRRL